MTWLLYRHRDYNNTSLYLRANKASFYGKNTDGEDFQPIVENFDMAVDVAEVRIDFPEKVSPRYVKFTFENWNTSGGNTIQVSEFNLGNTIWPVETGMYPPVWSGPTGLQVNVYPNPVEAGQPFYIRSDGDLPDAKVSIFTLMGREIRRATPLTSDHPVEQTINRKGIYFIEVRHGAEGYVFKLIVK
jgi:hypothetical protein